MSEFVDFVGEILTRFGTVRARKMFGGYGLYRDGVMFAIIDDDTLYLKADDASVHYFVERGLGQFEYSKAGKTVAMSYYLAPEEFFDDTDEAVLWAGRAYEAALRAGRRNRKPRGRSRRDD